MSLSKRTFNKIAGLEDCDGVTPYIIDPVERAKHEVGRDAGERASAVRYLRRLCSIELACRDSRAAGIYQELADDFEAGRHVK